MNLSSLDKLQTNLLSILEQNDPVLNGEETHFYTPSFQKYWWISQLAHLHCVVITTLPALRKEKSLPSIPSSSTALDGHHLMSKAEMSSSPLLPPGWSIVNLELRVLMPWPHTSPRMHPPSHSFHQNTFHRLHFLHWPYHFSAFDNLRCYLPNLAPLLADWNTKAQRGWVSHAYARTPVWQRQANNNCIWTVWPVFFGPGWHLPLSHSSVPVETIHVVWSL